MPKLHVLVIDDAALIRDFIRQGLYAVLNQIEILEATNGRHAKGVLETKPVDVVLCDWEMPEVNGQELLAWIRSHARLSKIPFIMVTGRGERDHVVAAMRAGIDGYVVKPFTIERLSKQVREVVAKRGLNLGVIPTSAAVADTVSILTGSYRKDGAIVPVDDLPEALPPFDIPAAVARMAGKQELVRKALIGFYTSFGKAPMEIDHLVASGKTEELLRLAHTIKGVAATLEATELTTASAALENTLLQDRDSEVQDLVNAVKLALVPALAAAARVLPPRGATPTSQQATASSTMNYAEMNSLITKLQTLLAGNNTKARELIAPLREILIGRNLDSHLNEIETQLSRFDFRGAGNTLATLTAALPSRKSAP